MRFTVDDYLTLLAPEVPQALVSLRALAQVRTVVRSLPGLLSGVFAFEGCDRRPGHGVASAVVRPDGPPKAARRRSVSAG